MNKIRRLLGISKTSRDYRITQLQTNVPNVFGFDQPDQFPCLIYNWSDKEWLEILFLKHRQYMEFLEQKLHFSQVMYCDLGVRWQGADFLVADEAESGEFCRRRFGEETTYWEEQEADTAGSRIDRPTLIKVNHGETQGRLVVKGFVRLEKFPRDWQVKLKPK